MAFENLNLGLLHKRTPKAGVFLNAYDKSQARSDIKRQQSIENQLNEAKLRLEQEKAEVAERQVSSLEKYHTSIAATQQQNADTAAGRLSMEQGQLASDNAAMASFQKQVQGGVQRIGRSGAPGDPESVQWGPEAVAGREAIQEHYINQPTEDSARNFEATREIIKEGITSPNGKVQAIALNMSRILEAESQTDIAKRNMETEQLNELMSYMNVGAADAWSNLQMIKQAYPNNKFFQNLGKEDIPALQKMGKQANPKQVMQWEPAKLGGKEGAWVKYGDGTTEFSSIPPGMQVGSPTQGLIKQAVDELGHSSKLMALINNKPALDEAMKLPPNDPNSFYKILSDATLEKEMLKGIELLMMQAAANNEGAEGVYNIIKGVVDQAGGGEQVYGLVQSEEDIAALRDAEGFMTEALVMRIFQTGGLTDDQLLKKIADYESRTGVIIKTR